MAKARLKDIKKRIKEQEEEVYGEETESGSSPDPEHVQEETTREMVEEVIGNKPKIGKDFSLEKEVKKDEDARWRK